MLRVESARPCDAGILFEMWTHHWVPPEGQKPGQVVFNQFTLLPRTGKKVRDALELPDMRDPFVMFGLAENNPKQARRLRGLGRPLVTSLVQMCSRSLHADHVRTPRGDSRSEVVHRLVWLPPGRPQLARAEPRMTSNQKGVGQARLVGESTDIVEHVVSAPLTEKEAAHARGALYGRLVLALPAVEAEGIPDVYVALHPQLDNPNSLTGSVLERRYQPDIDPFAQAVA